MPRLGRPRNEVDQSTYSGRVAARLRRLREKSGKTVPEMAQAVGVKTPTWYQYENGRIAVSLDLLPIISATLRVSIRDILPED